MIRRIAAVQVISLVALVGCGSPPVECGGRVSPERSSGLFKPGAHRVYVLDTDGAVTDVIAGS